MADDYERDIALLLDMMLAAEDAQTFVKGLEYDGFLESRLHQNAVIRSIDVVGEAAGKVSLPFCEEHPEIPWREITGMRHRLIHGYAEVRLDVVWQVVSERLPALIIAIEPLIPNEETG